MVRKMFNIIIEIISGFFIIAGLFFCCVGVLGMIRLPNIIMKAHAAGLIDTGGIFCICLGLAIKSGFALVSIKIMLMAILFILMSAPICYALMQIALRTQKKVFKEFNGEKNND